MWGIDVTSASFIVPKTQLRTTHEFVSTTSGWLCLPFGLHMAVLMDSQHEGPAQHSMRPTFYFKNEERFQIARQSNTVFTLKMRTVGTKATFKQATYLSITNIHNKHLSKSIHHKHPSQASIVKIQSRKVIQPIVHTVSSANRLSI